MATKFNPNNQLFIKLPDTILCFQQNELLFVEANRSYSILCFEGRETIKISKPMSWIIDKIEKGLLIKCHRSFVINRVKIKSIDTEKRIINLTDDSTVPISIRQLPEILKLIKN